ncbi:MAG: hypothetical protein K1V86_05535 [Duncaniella sp.]|jgi:hypothetical protein
MNPIDHNNYRQWVERFLDAETTLAEERELYAYFSRTDLPEEARRYRSMFGWYEDLPALDRATATATPSRPVRILPLRPWQWAGIAAMIAILLGLGFSMRRAVGHDEYIYASYMIRDGLKITDPEMVRAEFDRIESHADRYAASIESRLEDYDFPDIDIETDNPEIRNFINTSFKY